MLGVTDYGAFVAAVILFLFIPWPGNLALITSAGRGGIRGGLAATFGLILGDQVLMWLAVAGVAALLVASPAAFHAVQWLGAAYLAWLGARMFFARAGSAPVIDFKSRRYLHQALTITLLNPKAIVFYMAFFPLFVDSASHRGVLTFIYGLVAVLLAHFLAERLRANPTASRLMTRLAGVFLIGFGIRQGVGR